MSPRQLITLAAFIAVCGLPAWAQSDRYPASCQVKSPEMKVLNACRDLNATTTAKGFSRFFTTLDANDNGANFCYNSYVQVEGQAGQVMKLTVLRDDKYGHLRSYTYAVPAEQSRNLIGTSAALKLDDLKGQCFFYQPENDGNCSSFLGLMSEDIPMVVKLKQPFGGGVEAELTKDRHEISHAVSAKLINNDLDKVSLDQRLAKDLQDKIGTYVTTAYNQLKSKKNDPAFKQGLQSYQTCYQAFDEFTRTQHAAVLWTRGVSGAMDVLARETGVGPGTGAAAVVEQTDAPAGAK